MSAIKTITGEKQTVWEINVTDEEAAESNLLAQISAGNVTVSEFGRKKLELEEIFMSIVEGGENNG